MATSLGIDAVVVTRVHWTLLYTITVIIPRKALRKATFTPTAVAVWWRHMSLFDYMNRCTVFDYFQLKQKRPKLAVFQAKINISLHSNFVSHVYRVYELQMKQNNASSFFGQKQYKIPGKKYYLSIYLSICSFRKLYYNNFWQPRWISWMHHPTGDQEAAGSTPAEVGNILSWRLNMNYFLRSFSPFRWFKKGSCQFLAKECAQYWLTA